MHFYGRRRNMADPSSDNVVPLAKKKKREPGIVYLSTIPTSMNVKQIRERFSLFGEVGRVFLQPDKVVKAKGPSKSFSEGWVEFKNKKVAKKVAERLNGTQVGGKRRSPYYECLWSIKYLHRFKWAHLNERLAYEKAVRDQRLRVEIAQVKRESSHYVQAVEKSQKLRKRKRETDQQDQQDDGLTIKQRATDEEIRQRKKDKDVSAVDPTLLQSIFPSCDDENLTD